MTYCLSCPIAVVPRTIPSAQLVVTITAKNTRRADGAAVKIPY